MEYRNVMRVCLLMVGSVALSACASSHSDEYARVMESKIQQVRAQDREPITTLAFVEPRRDNADVHLDAVRALQEVEAAAGAPDDES